jgi:prepilin signal peptidase PulO-like enzyme (type II secretory pathway)
MAVMPVFFSFQPNNQSTAAVASALIGIVAGMVLIWGFRLIARSVLGIEAMGFGDVTLMGMIGGFLGWQPCLLIVFAAPFIGLIYGIVLWILGRGQALPYGPFLCLAAAGLVIAWHSVWQSTADVFSLGLAVISVCMFVIFVLFGVLLYLIHQIIARLHRFLQ